MCIRDSSEKLGWEQKQLGVGSCSIHGDKDQWEREKSLEQFSSGRAPLLFATDVAARGLDIPNVELVIQYELPQDTETFVHRSGRTGRAGNKGTAYPLLPPGVEEYAPGRVQAREQAGPEPPGGVRGMAAAAGGSAEAAAEEAARREQAEGFIGVADVAQCVLTMAQLPLSANVLELSVIPTRQPLVGRG